MTDKIQQHQNIFSSVGQFFPDTRELVNSDAEDCPDKFLKLKKVNARHGSAVPVSLQQDGDAHFDLFLTKGICLPEDYIVSYNTDIFHIRYLGTTYIRTKP